jgi:hypothetical protein
MDKLSGNLLLLLLAALLRLPALVGNRTLCSKALGVVDDLAGIGDSRLPLGQATLKELPLLGAKAAGAVRRDRDDANSREGLRKAGLEELGVDG